MPNKSYKNNVLIIIPAHNEENSIASVLQDIKKELKKNNIDNTTKILVIDDWSSDNTVDVVKKQGVKIISNFAHLGYGGSLQVGYRYAIEYGFKFTIQMDADGQHDPKNIIKIYKKLNTGKKIHSKNPLVEIEHLEKGTSNDEDAPDIVLGSRFLKDSVSFPISGVKKFAIWYFSKILKWSTKKSLTDPTTGLQGLSKSVIYYYSRFNQFDGKYPDSNILLEAARAGFNIAEIPAIMHAREDGTSMHSGFKPVYYMMHMTISVISVLLRKDLHKRFINAKLYALGLVK